MPDMAYLKAWFHNELNTVYQIFPFQKGKLKDVLHLAIQNTVQEIAVLALAENLLYMQEK